MDPESTAHPGGGGAARSLFGQDMLPLVADFRSHAASAYEAALYLLTHGHRHPAAQAVAALGCFDRAAFEVLGRHPRLPLEEAADNEAAALALYMGPLGRLHIRPAADAPVRYGDREELLHAGYVHAGPEVLAEIRAEQARALAVEERRFAAVRRALDGVHAAGELGEVLELAIDHVQHVESVCFYAGDRLFAVIERFVNLVGSPKGEEAFLPRLRDVPYAAWSRDEVLIVAALHALFLSGRSVRFEEFNGAALTATALWEKLHALLQAYRDAGCSCALPDGADLFALARTVREQSEKSVGAGWLRYRWIYGLSFQKSERILPSTLSTEDPLCYLRELAGDYEELAGGAPPAGITEAELFRELALASLGRDLQGVEHGGADTAARGWVERLIERIVESAVVATGADYGMSSSLRDLSLLAEPDDERLVAAVHALGPADFFTCFVARGLRGSLEKGAADAIAVSVQRRMMFNRWHFLPGNLARGDVAPGRHWYYPPMIPDIAVHSDLHRAAHAHAQVKHSVRAPGPDMSMPPLDVAGRPYRGFYDVRVVRRKGREFTTEEMLRTRRRTLWMSHLYAVLAERVAARGAPRFTVAGFQPGEYRDVGEAAAGGAPARRAEGDAGAEPTSPLWAVGERPGAHRSPRSRP